MAKHRGVDCERDIGPAIRCVVSFKQGDRNVVFWFCYFWFGAEIEIERKSALYITLIFECESNLSLSRKTDYGSRGQLSNTHLSFNHKIYFRQSDFPI